MTKTPSTLAKQMEREMQRAGRDCASYANEHCAIYEKDLEQIWPKKDKDRKKKLLKFAEQYGFRLRFYREGLFAIFDKPARHQVVNNALALWPAVVFPTG